MQFVDFGKQPLRFGGGVKLAVHPLEQRQAQLGLPRAATPC
jgi:hypothetical protein